MCVSEVALKVAQKALHVNVSMFICARLLFPLLHPSSSIQKKKRYSLVK